MNYEQILQAAKDEVARKWGYENWKHVSYSWNAKGIEAAHDEAALLAMQRVAELLTNKN